MRIDYEHDNNDNEEQRRRKPTSGFTTNALPRASERRRVASGDAIHRLWSRACPPQKRLFGLMYTGGVHSVQQDSEKRPCASRRPPSQRASSGPGTTARSSVSTAVGPRHSGRPTTTVVTGRCSRRTTRGFCDGVVSTVSMATDAIRSVAPEAWILCETYQHPEPVTGPPERPAFGAGKPPVGRRMPAEIPGQCVRAVDMR